MKRASILTVGVLGLLASAGCSQAPAPCQIQTGEYVVRFTPTGTPPAGCRPQFADLWAFQPFLDAQKRVLIAGFSETLGLPDTSDPDYQSSPLYFKGNFTAVDPDAANLCTISAGSISDGTTTFALTNMNWLSTALYLGTEWEADVTYSDATCPGATYKAQALNPPFNNAIGDYGCFAQADCDPFASPISSGINSKYDQGCHLEAWATDFFGDPDHGFCFFNADFPSLGSFTP